MLTYFGHSCLAILKQDTQKCACSFKMRLTRFSFSFSFQTMRADGQTKFDHRCLLIIRELESTRIFSENQ